MTDGDIELVTSRLEHMVLYLTYGIRAARKGTSQGLKPGKRNWRKIPGTTEQDPKVDQWSVYMFAGFYWYLVCVHRTQRCDPPRSLSLPDWDRIYTPLHTMLDHYSAQDAYNQIRSMFIHWDAIMEMIGPEAHMTHIITDNTLNYAAIVGKLDVITRSDTAILEDLYKMRSIRLAKEKSNSKPAPSVKRQIGSGQRCPIV